MKIKKKYQFIEIKTKDHGKYTDIALLADNLDFISEIEQTRKNYKELNLTYPLSEKDITEVKKFLSNIFYSPESIKIRFISRQSDGGAVAERSPAPPMRGLCERTLSSSKFEFVSSFLAPRAGFGPATFPLTGDRATTAPPRNINYRLLYQFVIIEASLKLLSFLLLED